MKELEIITLPHPTLRQPSQKVGFIDRSVTELATKMIDQATRWERGRPFEMTVGLAAVQINRPLRMILIRKNLQGEKPSSKAAFQILINPQITKRFGARTIQPEGCLSVPEYYANVERHQAVRVSALGLDGQPLRFKAEGFAARVLQHEMDHLKGIMTVDRATKAPGEKAEASAFWRLDRAGRLQPVDEREVTKSGILKDG